MSSKIKVSVFRTRLINLYNELGPVERDGDSMPKNATETLHSVLDRYDMPDLKDVLIP